MGINRTYISQTINEKFNKNYSSFINEYRIKEAQKLLLKDTNLTYEGIGFEVGFKSKSAFNSAFKTYTGVTPSIFVKNA
ncbi:MAG: AraC family transcriptional regulator, partial [SAR324 cluster bacterium]